MRKDQRTRCRPRASRAGLLLPCSARCPPVPLHPHPESPRPCPGSSLQRLGSVAGGVGGGRGCHVPPRTRASGYGYKEPRPLGSPGWNPQPPPHGTLWGHSAPTPVPGRRGAQGALGSRHLWGWLGRPAHLGPSGVGTANGTRAPSCQRPPDLDPRQAPRPARWPPGSALGAAHARVPCEGSSRLGAVPGPQPPAGADSGARGEARGVPGGGRGVAPPSTFNPKSPRAAPNVPFVTLISLRIFRTNALGFLNSIWGVCFLR